jgi:flagellar motility protein MotE (MotC chaperone)
MMLKIPAPRLLPTTIATLAALLLVKSGDLLEATFTAGHRTERGMMAVARAAGTAAEAGGGHAKSIPAPAAGEQKTSPANAVPDNPPISDSERAILLDLRQRRKELDALAETIAERESLLAAAEQKVAARVGELQALQKKLEGLDAAQKQKEDAGWQGLVKLYEAMKPRDAAAIFNELSMPVLLQVLDRMKEAKAAAVMSAMAPEKARDVTAELAQMRTGRNHAASAAEPASGSASEKTSGG